MTSARRYPVAPNYPLVATNQPAPLEVENTDVNAIFESAIKHISDEAGQITDQVNVSSFRDQKNKLLQKQMCMNNLRDAIQGLQRAVMADAKLLNEEAKSIALSTKNLAKVAVSTETTEEELRKALCDFQNVISPLNKTRAALAKLCLAVCVAAVLVVVVVAPLLAAVASISVGLYAGLMMGGILGNGVSMIVGGYFKDTSRPRFFQQRDLVEEKVERLSDHYSNRRLGKYSRSPFEMFA